jgi:predicted nucleotidyltransferase
MGKYIHMMVTNFLANIFSEKKVRVLKFFFDYPNGQFTGRDIALKTSMNHKTCLGILNQLHDLGLLHKEIIGKAHVFYMQPSFYWENIIYDIIKKESHIMHTITQELIDCVCDDVVNIILFGSYATKTETVSSDLDVCFIVPKKTEQFANKLNNLQDTFYKTYLCHLSPYIVTEQEYREEKQAIIKEIKLEGKVLWSKQKK